MDELRRLQRGEGPDRVVAARGAFSRVAGRVEGEAAGLQLQGYNVYGSGLWLDLVADNSYPLTTGGLFAVSAKYDLGESALCENTVATAVKSVETESEQVEQVYDLSGRRIDSKQRGVNIVRRADGKAVKVVVK